MKSIWKGSLSFGLVNIPIRLYTASHENERMRDLDREGRFRDWILEIHFVNQEKEIGGFFEQLLTVEY